ncbi:hypothetical protein AVEN_133676-1 [Araneus ventricosus]|uniref:Uncharacterized protein n=1 Tax=Araneus ventricosus TaxID=182803 RepID=A0A4Y2BA77_ARAVE|nr:hypothetical protein AVEN_133676-1 [Araneus ventricosus]
MVTSQSPPSHWFFSEACMNRANVFLWSCGVMNKHPGGYSGSAPARSRGLLKVIDLEIYLLLTFRLLFVRIQSTRFTIFFSHLTFPLCVWAFKRKTVQDNEAVTYH